MNKEKIENTLKEISKNFEKLSISKSSQIYEVANKLIISLKQNGKIIFLGNGGSAADAQHLAAELVGRYKKDRKALAGIAITTDTSTITAISNDTSFNFIFSRQLEAIGNQGDVILAISTSGNSQNIIEAILKAREMGITSVGLTGEQGGEMGKICDYNICVPSNRTDRIQEMHIAVGHFICELIEKSLR